MEGIRYWIEDYEREQLFFYILFIIYPVFQDTFPAPDFGYKTLAIVYIFLLKNSSLFYHFLDGKHNKKPGKCRAIYVE